MNETPNVAFFLPSPSSSSSLLLFLSLSLFFPLLLLSFPSSPTTTTILCAKKHHSPPFFSSSPSLLPSHSTISSSLLVPCLNSLLTLIVLFVAPCTFWDHFNSVKFKRGKSLVCATQALHTLLNRRSLQTRARVALSIYPFIPHGRLPHPKKKKKTSPSFNTLCGAHIAYVATFLGPSLPPPFPASQRDSLFSTC